MPHTLEQSRAIAAAKLQAIRDSYVARLPLQLAEIQAAWLGHQAAPSTDALTALHRLVHRLAGSAGLFGLRDVSRKAMALEQLIEQGLATGHLQERKMEQILQSIGG